MYHRGSYNERKYEYNIHPRGSEEELQPVLNASPIRPRSSFDQKYPNHLHIDNRNTNLNYQPQQPRRPSSTTSAGYGQVSSHSLKHG